MGKSRRDLPPKDPELRKLWFELRQRNALLTTLAYGAAQGVNIFKSKKAEPERSG